MINFVPPQKYNYSAYKDKTIDQYHDICGRVNTVLEGTTCNKILLGNLLRELWFSRTYAFRAKDAYSYDGNFYSGENNVAGVFFFVCDEEFGLDRSQVSRLMNVADEFSHEGKLRGPWAEYKYSALVELLDLTPEQRNEVKPDWTIRRIREYKKQLKKQSKSSDVDSVPENTFIATSQQENAPEDFSENIDFSKFSKDDLVVKCTKYRQDLKAAAKYISVLENELRICKEKLDIDDDDDFYSLLGALDSEDLP